MAETAATRPRNRRVHTTTPSDASSDGKSATRSEREAGRKTGGGAAGAAPSGPARKETNRTRAAQATRRAEPQRRESGKRQHARRKPALRWPVLYASANDITAFALLSVLSAGAFAAQLHASALSATELTQTCRTLSVTAARDRMERPDVHLSTLDPERRHHRLPFTIRETAAGTQNLTFTGECVSTLTGVHLSSTAFHRP